MKKLSIKIDEQVLAKAQEYASQCDTTVAKLVREFLEKLVTEGGSAGEETEAQHRARMDLVELAKRAGQRPAVDWKWNRDEIYEERLAQLGRNAGAPAGFAEAPRGERVGAGADAADDELFPALTTVTDDPPEPGHDAWFRRQVQKALDDKKAGKTKYTNLSDVAARFGVRVI